MKGTRIVVDSHTSICEMVSSAAMIPWERILSCEMGLVPLPFTAISTGAVGVDFMQWLTQEPPRATIQIQNNPDGYRIAKNTLDRQVFIVKPTVVIYWFPTPLYTILDVFCWYDSVCQSVLVTYFVFLTGYCLSSGIRRQFVLCPLEIIVKSTGNPA